MRYARALVLLACLACIAQRGWAQQNKVDARNRYERLLCAVPMVGSGTGTDPRRPMYAPMPGDGAAQSGTAIIAYGYQISDDGTHALVEFTARDRSAFRAILADRSMKCFVRGRDKRSDIEATFKAHKKDFDLEKFGVLVP